MTEIKKDIDYYLEKLIVISEKHDYGNGTRIDEIKKEINQINKYGNPFDFFCFRNKSQKLLDELEDEMLNLARNYSNIRHCEALKIAKEAKEILSRRQYLELIILFDKYLVIDSKGLFTY